MILTTCSSNAGEVRGNRFVGSATFENPNMVARATIKLLDWTTWDSKERSFTQRGPAQNPSAPVSIGVSIKGKRAHQRVVTRQAQRHLAEAESTEEPPSLQQRNARKLNRRRSSRTARRDAPSGRQQTKLPWKAGHSRLHLPRKSG